MIDAQGREVQNCGFKIGGGIDQDFHKSPQGYKDSVSGDINAILISFATRLADSIITIVLIDSFISTSVVLQFILLLNLQCN